MVKQYPHIGKKIVQGDSVLNGKGDWVTSEPVETVLRCRIEPTGGSRNSQYIIGLDGTQITFMGIVYIPFPVEEIKPGTLFEVWDGERLIVKSTVKQFSKGQLNARVWL